MKHSPKHAHRREAGGGDHDRLAIAETKDRQRLQENFSKKREPHDGILAVQFDPEGRLFEGSGRVTREARERVQSLLTTNVARLLKLALQEEDSVAKKWAGEVLANIVSRIGVEDRNLRRTNKSYRDWRSKIGKKLGTVVTSDGDNFPGCAM